MRKTRLYLDTSPIIMVEPNQDPIRQVITKEFFRIVAERSDEYELFVSPVTIEELEAGVGKYGEGSLLFLNSLDHTELPENDKSEKLSLLYSVDGVLSKAPINDLRHVAYAVISCCDYVITWNMRHLANEQTVTHVNAVNGDNDYGRIFHCNPRICYRRKNLWKMMISPSMRSKESVRFADDITKKRST